MNQTYLDKFQNLSRNVRIAIYAAVIFIIALLMFSCSRPSGNDKYAPPTPPYVAPQSQAIPAPTAPTASPVVIQQQAEGPGWGGAAAAGMLGYMMGKSNTPAPAPQIIERQTTVIKQAPAPVTPKLAPLPVAPVTPKPVAVPVNPSPAPNKTSLTSPSSRPTVTYKPSSSGSSFSRRR